jgi:hypothetical protein
MKFSTDEQASHHGGSRTLKPPMDLPMVLRGWHSRTEAERSPRVNQERGDGL